MLMVKKLINKNLTFISKNMPTRKTTVSPVVESSLCRLVDFRMGISPPSGNSQLNDVERVTFLSSIFQLGGY